MHHRPIYRLFETVVRSVVDVTPHMRRITLHGESLAGFASDRPGQWVKLFFDASETGRAFTIRQWRPDMLEMDIDFVRHDGGMAGTWIATAAPGLVVRLAGPRSDFRYDPTRKLFLFGDETALPAISAIVEALPAAARAVAVIEIKDDAAVQQIETAAIVHWSWIPSRDGRSGRRLSAYARHLTIGPESAQLWIACECSAAREMRCTFAGMGFNKTTMHASGYWKMGASEHVDSDSDY